MFQGIFYVKRFFLIVCGLTSFGYVTLNQIGFALTDPNHNMYFHLEHPIIDDEPEKTIN
jgi:hypothetical protein